MLPQPFILSDRRLPLPIAWEAQYRGLAGVDCAATSESGCFTQASWLQPPTVHCCFGTLPWASNVHLSKAVGQTIDGLRSSPWLCSVVLGDSVLRDTALTGFGASHQRDSLLVSAAVPPIFAERNNPLSADSTASSPHRRLVAVLVKVGSATHPSCCGWFGRSPWPGAARRTADAGSHKLIVVLPFSRGR